MRAVTCLGASRLATARVGLVHARMSSMAVAGNQQAAAESHKIDPLDGMRRRLLYRSKQRGWLEMDIMLGNWAFANLNQLEADELQQFHELLNMENPDLYKWLTGQTPVPDDVQNDLLRKLCNDLRQHMAPKVSVASAASFEGKVWE